MRFRRLLTVAGATSLVLLAGALPASAHPYFTDGATAPASSLATLTLAMAHGCGNEDAAGGDPTTEISVEVPAAVSYLEPGEVDGYEVELEGDGPVPEVVTWTAVDGGTPAPELTMDVVVDGAAGDELHIRVVQGCDGFEYRWVGTPDEPADDPAVRLTLTEPDPDAPAPPAPEPDADEAADAGDTDAPADDEVVDGAGETDEIDADGDDADADGDEADADDTPTAVDELPTEPPADEGGGVGWLPIVLGALVLAGIGGLIGARRRPVADPTAVDEAGQSRDLDR